MGARIEDVLAGKYKHVWIYGAGRAGRKLSQAFYFLKIAFDGVAVSKYDGIVLPGVKVCGLPEIDTASEDTVFLITVSAKFHGGIMEGLEDKGYGNYVIWDAHCLCELWKTADFDFTDRRKNYGKCCFILAGYKEFLWESVFERFDKFIPPDVDVCIVSSGLYSSRLAGMAEKNSWSYLATKINSVTLAQNAAFALYENYRWVYKVDEDIFVTEDSFEKMYLGYKKAVRSKDFVPGISVPLIPVNGYGYSVVLNRLGLSEKYQRDFGDIKAGGNPDSEIEKNPEAAVFMWTQCPQIDELNRLFEKHPEGGGMAGLCGVRFSIGFILMERLLWDNMQGFTVSGNADMGTDEEELCAECINRSKAITVCGDTVAGHFAFGRQTERMKEIYDRRREWFAVK